MRKNLKVLAKEMLLHGFEKETYQSLVGAERKQIMHFVLDSLRNDSEIKRALDDNGEVIVENVQTIVKNTPEKNIFFTFCTELKRFECFEKRLSSVSV